jgi:SAM-dependent methyltransferase
MNIKKVTDLYVEYIHKEVPTVVHPGERMTSPNYAVYESIGRDAIRSIFAGLCLATSTLDIRRVLDYGCGHGRVARHLRTFFPSAEMWFADVRADGADFCATEFAGTGIVLPTEFSKQLLPTEIDLAWAGSIFTHIDFERAKILFSTLFDALSPGGLLVITTHGRSKLTEHGRKSIGLKYAEKLESGYMSNGYAYVSYDRPDLGEWGVSLMDMKRTVDFLALRDEADLILYSECGWAGQDVLIFGRKK